MNNNQNDAIFDGFSFVDNGLVLTNINHLTLASRENQLVGIANKDGKELVDSYRGEKPIYIAGYFDGETPEDAQLMYDVLAAVVNRQKRPLIVPHAGSTRQYIATPQNCILEEPDGLNRLTFSFEFVVPSGASRDTNTTTLVSQVVTTPSTSLPLTVLGSDVARPLITLTYTAVTGGTNKTVSIRNGRDFIGLTIQRNWVAGDTVVIDSTNFQIYINGVLTPPDGRLPSWMSGTGTLYYADTFTSRTVSILATYNRANL